MNKRQRIEDELDRLAAEQRRDGETQEQAYARLATDRSADEFQRLIFELRNPAPGEVLPWGDVERVVGPD